ncbi:hypothetical protein [Vibrio rarus]|uniref:hypothetical protein n=1 Tax=Vibrio rarus TaxID=413403 RepID=UPI0021C40253|nr:hypothetical protein [Vibrio rarus]
MAKFVLVKGGLTANPRCNRLKQEVYMIKFSPLALAAAIILPLTTLAAEQSQLLISMPDNFNSPASADIDTLGNVYFSSPNFHNETLMKAGDIDTPKMAAIGKLATENQVATWYAFSEADLHPSMSTRLQPVYFSLMR